MVGFSFLWDLGRATTPVHDKACFPRRSTCSGQLTPGGSSWCLPSNTESSSWQFGVLGCLEHSCPLNMPTKTKEGSFVQAHPMAPDLL